MTTREDLEWAEDIDEVTEILANLFLEREQRRREYEREERALNNLIADAEAEINNRRQSVGRQSVTSAVSSSPIVARSATRVVETTPTILRATPITTRSATSAVQIQLEEEEDFEIGDYVIITSRTGGLRGTKARIAHIHPASYDLKIPGQRGTILRRKESVRRPNRNGLWNRW